MLSVGCTTVFRWLEKGHLHGLKYPTGSYRIPRTEVDRFLQESSGKERTYSVVIIDDEPLFLESVQDMLESVDMPLHIRAYTDEFQALLGIGERKPDIIIVDYMLRGMDGATISCKIRENPEYSDIPLVLISGKVAAPPCGCRQMDAFLKKPFSVDDIEQLLRETLTTSTVSGTQGCQTTE